MSKPILVPDPRLQPPNFGVGETYSWVQVGGVQERQMYARATYVTNLADLVLNLSATDVRIGGVEIVDNDSGLRCDVTSFEYEDGSFNALRVTTQDLEPIYDGVAIGDQYGNMVTVNESTSSLNVNVTNFLELSSIIQTNRITSLLEALTAREYDININAQDINVNTDEVESQLRTIITLLNSITATSEYGTTPTQPLSTFDLTPARNANAAIDWNTIPVIATINTFTPLESYSCNVVTVYNSSTDTINIKRTGNGYAIPLQKDSSIVINVIGNANEISAFSSTSELTASALVTKF